MTRVNPRRIPATSGRCWRPRSVEKPTEFRRWNRPKDLIMTVFDDDENHHLSVYSGRNRACQLTASLTFARPQTEVNDHPASLRVTCGQYVESPTRVWFSRPGLSVQISSYPNSSWCWVSTDPIYLPSGIERTPHPVAARLKPRGYRAGTSDSIYSHLNMLVNM